MSYVNQNIGIASYLTKNQIIRLQLICLEYETLLGGIITLYYDILFSYI